MDGWMDGRMDGGEGESGSHQDQRLTGSVNQVASELSLLVQLLPPSASERTVCSGGGGTTGGLPVRRDQVPAVLPKLLSVSARPSCCHSAPGDSREPPLRRLSWMDEDALTLSTRSGLF